MKPIVITDWLVSRLLSEARRSPHAEVCGLVGTGADLLYSVYPVANVAATPADRFDMDPAGQIAAFKQMRNRDERLFAVYHSHPGTPAVPSARDLAGWTYPQAIYLIVSLAGDRAPAIRAWQQAGKEMVERGLACRSSS